MPRSVVTDAPLSMKKAPHAFISNVLSSSLVNGILERMRVSIADAQIVHAPSLERISLPHDERRGFVKLVISSSLPFVISAFSPINGQDDFFVVVCAAAKIGGDKRRNKTKRKT